MNQFDKIIAFLSNVYPEINKDRLWIYPRSDWLSIIGLYFIVNGTAFVHWLEHNVRDESRSHSFASTQEYFSFKREILSERSSE